MRGNVCISQICPAFRPLGDLTASPSPPRKTSKILFPILSSPEDSEDEISVKDVPSLLKRTTSVSTVLSHEVPRMKPPIMKPKSSAKVLTSVENLRSLEGKEKKKIKLQKAKEKRMKEREEKRLLKGNTVLNCV